MPTDKSPELRPIAVADGREAQTGADSCPGRALPWDEGWSLFLFPSRQKNQLHPPRPRTRVRDERRELNDRAGKLESSLALGLTTGDEAAARLRSYLPLLSPSFSCLVRPPSHVRISSLSDWFDIFLKCSSLSERAMDASTIFF